MLARFFVDRPVFATVLSIVIVIIGVVSMTQLPVAQYPEVAPPTISISAVYPGASAKVVSDTVAAPIEQEVNGVEGMLYMTSKCTNDGAMLTDVTFELGTDIDDAQVLVQNRVAVALSDLPDEVTRQGVTVKKRSPSILLAINIVSNETPHDAEQLTALQLRMSRFAMTQIKDELARIKGVGDVTFLGAREYGMRLWLNPELLSARDMTAGDVIRALREQNVQVAAGQLGQPPGNDDLDRQITISTLGRLVEPAQFDDIIVKQGLRGEVVRVRDVGRSEHGAKNYEISTFLDDSPSVAMAVFQLPGSNALATAEAVRAKMRELRRKFPKELDYKIVYDTTVFVDESIHEVYKTLFEAFVLVFIVVLLFLQDWRATLLPMIDVPVSLIGTFAVMAMLGFSLNNLSLFGLVLAIGIVVDDAIVVVENIERWMAKGLSPREATIRAMDEITGPVIAITLVLASVFIPTTFIAGITGEFYRQFALTIAASTIISAVNALTMAPARAVTLLKPHKTDAHGHHEVREALPRWGYAAVFAVVAYVYLFDIAAHAAGIHTAGHGADPAVEPSPAWKIYGLSACLAALGAVVGWFVAHPLNIGATYLFRGFNRGFDFITVVYGRMVGRIVRFSLVALVVYAGLIGLTYRMNTLVPGGFIPEQDKGYLVVAAILPEGASLSRTEDVMTRASQIARKTPGVAHTLRIPGYHLLQGVNLTSAGGMFVILEPFDKRRHDPKLHASQIVNRLRAQFADIQEAQVVAFGAPPVDGIGSTGGFKLYVQDEGGLGLDGLADTTRLLAAKANEVPGVVGSFSSFRVDQPQLFLEIDRTKVKTLQISLGDVYEALQSYLGGNYANDFTEDGRNWQVNVQADAPFRRTPADIINLKVRSGTGSMVPLGSVLTVEEVTGPSIVSRFNMKQAADISGGLLPGYGSSRAVEAMREVTTDLPPTVGYEWTELTLQQIKAGEDWLTKIVFPLGVVLVFMVLAAQYESWSLPTAVILIVPMSILSSLVGVWLSRGDNNIFTQVGLLVLVALAAKNAILIVEFARQREMEGASRFDAVLEAARTRLRPIIMTSLAFILGVVPLAIGTGAGAEMRNAIGIAVFSGMLGVTFFGIFLTPVFYDVVRRIGDRGTKPPAAAVAHPHVAPPSPPPSPPPSSPPAPHSNDVPPT